MTRLTYGADVHILLFTLTYILLNKTDTFIASIYGLALVSFTNQSKALKS